jgi:NADPH-dependent 2,4-dienoyl-CoA reductase/sulfur reductase-like enzyme
LLSSDLQDLRVSVHLQTRVSAIDPDGRIVRLSDGRSLIYDAILIATGGKPRTLAIPGANLPGVVYLRTLEDAASIRDGLSRSQLSAAGSSEWSWPRPPSKWVVRSKSSSANRN